jgi:TetR/AcrR family transcriptional regulator
MNKSFNLLKEEKRQRITNAAMQVFSKSPYGKASTDDIAALAGISKGSLFYHFKNKKELYCYLYEYSCNKIYQKINDLHALEDTDFFERNAKVIEARVRAMIEYPYIFDFAVQAYYETESVVAEEIKAINKSILNDAYLKMNEGIDISRFRNKADVNKAINMIIWIGEGCIKEKRAADSLELKQLQAEINEYMELLKHGFYKQEGSV